ncbi:hypothetical protein TNCT_685451 [Trichonephila clavata]|uniref:Uncharacterized protein n=1 Tax=Trichonephila clavata TaxID=2740835 RepID=A0A8X6IJM5_TRICU|nr:hypothetical protein TNCT_685451 [Trichonephila clavata]
MSALKSKDFELDTGVALANDDISTRHGFLWLGGREVKMSALKSKDFELDTGVALANDDIRYFKFDSVDDEKRCLRPRAMLKCTASLRI